jgi:hypothetical protein
VKAEARDLSDDEQRAARARSDLQAMLTQNFVEDLSRLRGPGLGKHSQRRPDNLRTEHDVEPAGLELAQHIVERPARVFRLVDQAPFDAAARSGR